MHVHTYDLPSGHPLGHLLPQVSPISTPFVVHLVLGASGSEVGGLVKPLQRLVEDPSTGGLDFQPEGREEKGVRGDLSTLRSPLVRYKPRVDSRGGVLMGVLIPHLLWSRTYFPLLSLNWTTTEVTTYPEPS